MSEDVKVEFQNVPTTQEAPPDYSNPNYESASSEPSVVISMQNEPKPISKFRSHLELIKRHYPGFLIGLFAFLVIFFFCKALGTKSTSSQKEIAEPTCQKRVIGYYGGWGNQEITERQIEKLTHIIFNAIKTNENDGVEFLSDEARFSFLNMKNKARIMKSDVKILFSTGHVAQKIMDSKTRKTRISSISALIIEQQMNGVELYYRWPKTEEEQENYIFFIRELRYKFEKMEKATRRKVPYLISIVTPSTDFPAETETILHELLDYSDFLNVETDNYYAPNFGTGNTGPLAPLYSRIKNQSIDGTMKAYTCTVSQPSRLNFIVPFRGTFWNKVDDHLHSTSAIYKTADKSANNHSSAAWRNLKVEDGWDLKRISWHSESRTPYIWDAENRKLFNFENEQSLKEKMKYLMERNIGGVVVDGVELDDDSLTLLNAVTSVDLCSGPKYKKDEVRYNCENSDDVKESEYLFNFSVNSFNFGFIVALCFSYNM